MSGSLADHDELVVAFENMTWALAHGVNQIAGEAARTSLLLVADRCGYDGKSPLLVWAKRRVETYRDLLRSGGRELDAAVRSMPRDELAQIFGAA